MSIPIEKGPSPWRPFRVYAVASLIGMAVGGASLFACWAATGYDPQSGDEFGQIGTLMVVLLGGGLLTHLPWERM